LVKLQQQLQNHLESIFTKSTPKTPAQQDIQTMFEKSQEPQQLQYSTPQLTEEDKKTIAQLTDTVTPTKKPIGFLAHIYSLVNRPNMEEADVHTLHQLIHDKIKEIEAIQLKNKSSPTSPESAPQTTNNTNSSTNVHVTDVEKLNTQSNTTNAIPVNVIEQIKRRKELRAAGVPLENLPKLDLSGLSPGTLKQIQQIYQQNKLTNTTEKSTQK